MALHGSERVIVPDLLNSVKGIPGGPSVQVHACRVQDGHASGGTPEDCADLASSPEDGRLRIRHVKVGRAWQSVLITGRKVLLFEPNPERAARVMQSGPCLHQLKRPDGFQG
eukprot:5113803-Amphidinium_carterae.2